MTLGIGTVLTTDQVKAIVDIGVDFGVSPGCNPKIIDAARSNGLPFAPGVATPSDIETAIEHQCRVLKFFPAEPSGGLAYLTSMAAPYAHLDLQFIPLGGLHSGNAADYLKSPLIMALGGSWIAKRSLIRGEEWINSTPKHVLLYRAFGWEMPAFYHLGLLRNADRSKLSKRKNPVSVFHYRELGYLPETFINFLANLGYSFGDDVERFTLDEWIENFDWSHVSRGGPVFDSKKLDAFSGDDIRALSPEALYENIVERVLDRDRLMALLAEAQPRIERLDDFIPYVSCFFGASLDYSQVLDSFKVKNRSRKEVLGVLKDYLAEIETDPGARDFDVEGLEAFSREFCARKDWKPKELFPLLRLAATARKATPPLFTTLHLCGKDRFRMRVRDVMAALKAGPNW